MMWYDDPAYRYPYTFDIMEWKGVRDETPREYKFRMRVHKIWNWINKKFEEYSMSCPNKVAARPLHFDWESKDDNIGIKEVMEASKDPVIKTFFSKIMAGEFINMGSSTLCFSTGADEVTYITTDEFKYDYIQHLGIGRGQVGEFTFDSWHTSNTKTAYVFSAKKLYMADKSSEAWRQIAKLYQAFLGFENSQLMRVLWSNEYFKMFCAEIQRKHEYWNKHIDTLIQWAKNNERFPGAMLDLKPANILVDEKGELVYIVDPIAYKSTEELFKHTSKAKIIPTTREQNKELINLAVAFVCGEYTFEEYECGIEIILEENNGQG